MPHIISKFLFFTFFLILGSHIGECILLFLYRGIIGMMLAHAAPRRTENFITYFWRQDQQSTITGINAINDCHRSTMRYQGSLKLIKIESDGFWIN